MKDQYAIKNLNNLGRLIYELPSYLVSKTFETPEKSVEIITLGKSISDYHKKNIEPHFGYRNGLSECTIDTAIEMLKSCNFLWSQFQSLYILCNDEDNIKRYFETSVGDTE